MRVVAIERGFYRGNRKRPGEVFDMDEADMKRDQYGQPQPPAWVNSTAPTQGDEFAKGYAEFLREEADDKFIEGALAASSGAAGKAKQEALEAHVKGGELQPGDSPIAAGAVAASGSAGHKAKKKAFEDALAGRA